jgi:hypothetical protein
LPVTQDLTGVNLGGLTLLPGVYKFATSAQLTGALVLNANSDPERAVRVSDREHAHDRSRFVGRDHQ